MQSTNGTQSANRTPGGSATSELPEEKIGAIETLIDEIEASADPDTRERVRKLLGAVLEVHGAAIERLLGSVFECGGQEAVDRCAKEELLGSVLVLHGIHPQSIEARVQQALDGVRPYLESHGGNVGFGGVTTEGKVRLILEGSCSGCPSSSATLKYTVEEAVMTAAPDVEGIVVVEQEEVAHLENTEDGAGFIPISDVMWDDCPFPDAS